MNRKQRRQGYSDDPPSVVSNLGAPSPEMVAKIIEYRARVLAAMPADVRSWVEAAESAGISCLWSETPRYVGVVLVARFAGEALREALELGFEPYGLEGYPPDTGWAWGHELSEGTN